jgi:hypothetical protein
LERNWRSEGSCWCCSRGGRGFTAPSTFRNTHIRHFFSASSSASASPHFDFLDGKQGAHALIIPCSIACYNGVYAYAAAVVVGFSCCCFCLSSHFLIPHPGFLVNAGLVCVRVVLLGIFVGYGLIILGILGLVDASPGRLDDTKSCLSCGHIISR